MTNRRRRRTALQMSRTDDSAVSLDDGSGDAEHVEEVRQAPAPSERVMEIVRRAAQTRQQVADDINASPDSGLVTPEEDLNPGTRMEQVRGRAPEYEREYRLKLLHRLLMRKIPLDEVAAQLQVSLATVHRDRREIHRRLRDELSRLDMNAFLGETMAFYGEAGAMAMRIATGIKTATPHKLAALRTAMTSRKELGQFFSAAGVFDQLPFIPDDEAQSGDLAKLVELSERLLVDEESQLDELGGLEDLEDENISLIL